MAESPVDLLRQTLLRYADTDESVTGAAFTGSHAVGEDDRWSDTDLVLAVRGDLAPVLDRWTARLSASHGAVHHWDVPSGPAIIRVFLLPGWREVDLTFAPESHFGPRGPQWRTVFGSPRDLPPFPPPDRNTLVGMVWHHALHVRLCLRRSRSWQAAHWIEQLRAHLITLACLRLGLPFHYAKGAHLLPESVTAPLAATLVRDVGEPELSRAFAALLDATATELELSDPATATRLLPMLTTLR
ncbi:hypothetical protein [Actinoplanes sp. NPDC051851]|uniref:hypothetical protein n=1 Tax=Actinoplanes sp. NPDC051851 TaxID=3154753 RepID=UPI003434DFB7